MQEEFPGNSNKERVSPPEPEKPAEASDAVVKDKPEPITKGKVGLRKKPLGLRFKEMFAEDGRSYAEDIVKSIVVPMLKETLDSVISQTVDNFKRGVQQAIFGDAPRPSSAIRSTVRAPYDYNKISTSSTTTSIRRAAGGFSSRAPVRRSNVIKEVFLDDKPTAQAVLEELEAMCDSIGHVTVGDYYNLVQVPITPTDESWGWDRRTLNQAHVIVVNESGRREFMINLPRPLPIEN
jgi:hypothetical protein